MNDEIKKCSNSKHSEINAINYCPECNSYFCNKCSNFHSEFFIKHQVYNLNKNNLEIFTGKCNEINHRLNLRYFCKTHNKLCCAACLSKIKENGDGLHFDCDVVPIEKIKEEKKSKLNENIIYLEEFSQSIENSINKLKEILKTINESKDELKKKISEIFTKLRCTLNEREDALFKELDNLYEKKFIKEDIIKKGEKMPNQIKLYLDKGKELNEDWNDDNKLINNINNSINIENNIKSIIEINDAINKMNSQTINIHFLTEENEVKDLLENIKVFGKIGEKETKFKFKFKKAQYYTITNNGLNVTKNRDGWDGLVFGDKEIPKNKITKWKIKLNSNLNKAYDDFYIGIGNNNFKTNADIWCIYSHCIKIQKSLKGSISQFNNYKEAVINNNDIIEVLVDRISNQLSFAINDVNFGIACSNIPKDIELYPVVLLYEGNLNLEII